MGKWNRHVNCKLFLFYFYFNYKQPFSSANIYRRLQDLLDFLSLKQVSKIGSIITITYLLQFTILIAIGGTCLVCSNKLILEPILEELVEYYYRNKCHLKSVCMRILALWYDNPIVL